MTDELVPAAPLRSEFPPANDGPAALTDIAGYKEGEPMCTSMGAVAEGKCIPLTFTI